VVGLRRHRLAHHSTAPGFIRINAGPISTVKLTMPQNRIDQIAAALNCSRSDARKLFESEGPDGMPTAALTRNHGVVRISEVGLDEEIKTTEGWMKMADGIVTALREDGIELPANLTTDELRTRLDNERRYQAMASEGLPTLCHARHSCGHRVYWDSPAQKPRRRRASAVAAVFASARSCALGARALRWGA
jgi:hypothetical protein